MSIAVRAALAIVLLIGFYLFAIGIACVLFYLPYAEAVYAHRIHAKLALLSVVGGLAILWSIVPRFSKFVAPGPELRPEQHPRLFSMVGELAQATGQAPPKAVFLVPDVNAFVASRGGLMGFGSDRIMGIGLPLLQVLTIPELRAVLAHEFGHYHGGDVRIGPLIYQTRAAIGRTIGNVGSDLLRLPFEWYGNFFLRVTHAVSRAQERTADALAAKVVGAAPLARALEKVAGAAAAFGPYFQEVVAVLNRGCRPPIAQGFAMFVAVPSIADSITKVVDEHRVAPSDPLDTHPPLGERLALLGNPVGSDSDTRLAITLLDNVPDVELELLRSLAPDGGPLRAVRWEEVGMEAHLAGWQKIAGSQSAAFALVSWDSLAALRSSPEPFLAKLALPNLPADPAARRGAAEYLLGVWFALRLVDQGWTVEDLPGQPVRMIRGDERVDLDEAFKDPGRFAPAA